MFMISQVLELLYITCIMAIINIIQLFTRRFSNYCKNNTQLFSSM